MREREPEFPDELPAGLREELRGVYRSHGIFPEGKDVEILAAARAAGGAARGAGGRRWRVGQWRWVVGGAMAAAVALAGTLYLLPTVRSQRAAMVAERPAGYVRVGDIRDAFYLQRELEKQVVGAGAHASSSLEASWDANRDGRIDDADVRALALAAVSLEKGGREPGGGAGGLKGGAQ